MRWSWNVAGGFAVEADLSMWSGHERVWVNQEIVSQRRGFKLKSVHSFPVGEATAELTMRLKWLVSPDAALRIDGEQVAPTAGPENMPGWAWLFIALCIAIPVVSLGGAIPGALGGGSAATCAVVARVQRSPLQRALLCLLVTATAWALFAALALALTR